MTRRPFLRRLSALALTVFTLPAFAVLGTDAATRVFGDTELAASGARLTLRGSGPSFTAWALAGVGSPPAVHTHTVL